MKPSPKHPRHHELAQLYLRGFCAQAQKPQLYEFRRAGGPFKPGKKGSCNPRERGIRSIALRPDGYVAYDEDGTEHYEYEVRLQQHEERALPALRRALALQPLDASDKEALTDYIWLTFRRVTRHDADIQPLLNKQVSAISFESEARRLAFTGQFGKAHDLFRKQEYLQSDKGSTTLQREYMFRPYDEVRARVLNRPWALRVAPQGSFFLTNDAPVIFDRAHGLDSAPLYFPLNRRVLLEVQLAGRRDLDYNSLSDDQTMAMNRFIIGAADKEVYSLAPDQWIYDELVRRSPLETQLPRSGEP